VVDLQKYRIDSHLSRRDFVGSSVGAHYVAHKIFFAHNDVNPEREGYRGLSCGVRPKVFMGVLDPGIRYATCVGLMTSYVDFMLNKSLIRTGLFTLVPGLFLIGYNIGTKSITTMAKTGAEHKISLFWALVLLCIFTYSLIVAYGKFTTATGNTVFYNIRAKSKSGWLLALYILNAQIPEELLVLCDGERV